MRAGGYFQSGQQRQRGRSRAVFRVGGVFLGSTFTVIGSDVVGAENETRGVIDLVWGLDFLNRSAGVVRHFD